MRLIADQSQCSRTKQQWQALKRLERHGAAVRVAQGGSIKSAYADDSRDVRIGSNLRGLRHTKSILFEGPGGPELVTGSVNFTTSSKANAELGLKVSLPAGSPAAQTWPRAPLLSRRQREDLAPSAPFQAPPKLLQTAEAGREAAQRPFACPSGRCA